MTKKMEIKGGREQNSKKIDKLFDDMIENCDKCDLHELCEIIKKLKIIHFTIKDIDKATSSLKLKVGIAAILDVILILMIVLYPPYLVYILIIFAIIELYVYLQRYKYKKETIDRLEKLGNALGIPEEKQKEIRRSLEGKPTVIAEKMMSCKLRKEHGLDYCAKCPDSYTCASGFPSQPKMNKD